VGDGLPDCGRGLEGLQVSQVSREIGKERAARERAERERKHENYHVNASNGYGVQVASITLAGDSAHTALDTARRLGYTLVLRYDVGRTWLVKAVKL
jgi:chloramphenicol 3-O-phosphotransferase